MKNLELNQMEKINGEGCGTSAASALLTDATLAYLALSAGPVGWFGLVAVAAWGLAHYNFTEACA